MAQPTHGSKVLLMGRAGAGKTSMKSIIFANYLARETNRLHHTNFIEHSSLRFLGNLRLNLWDCGGQDVFMENYFESQRENIFQNARVLIYVVLAAGDKRSRSESDVVNKPQSPKDLTYFQNAMESIRTFAPDCKVFCLIHQIDLVHETRREEVLRTYERDLVNAASGRKVVCYGTSIWDGSLFKAWSQIVYHLIPDMNHLEEQLAFICKTCGADEIILFEKNTFLLIAHSSTKEMKDSHRFEKISNIVKQFKLSCGKMKTSFKCFQVKNQLFSATIEPFVEHSYVMVVVSEKHIQDASTSANLWAARNHLHDLAKAGVSFGAHV